MNIPRLWSPGSNRPWIFAGIAVLTIIVLTVFAAPTGNSEFRGSSYNRAPDGYGAWYAYMAERGTPLTRWQKPFADLADASGMTLVQVSPSAFRVEFSPAEETWINQGNRLIRVGVRGRVTRADFRSRIPTELGAIVLETRRRFTQPLSRFVPVLTDDYGSIAWRSGYGEGEVVSVIPPDFAANAYQDAPGNFEFLAQLVADGGDRLLIDEYIHGYRDSDVILEEVAGNWISYLAQTPLVPILVQGGILLLILIWAGNRRSHPPGALTSPQTNNSKAYIEALASVLQKAERREFVVEMIGREEQRQIQHRLGLGNDLVEPAHLLQTWQQQTGRPAAELNQVLRPYWEHQRLSQSALMAWIAAIRNVHHTLGMGGDRPSR